MEKQPTNFNNIENLKTPERYAVKDVDSFTTSRGSVYKFLEDGRVSRFKTKTKEQQETQDMIVFIPNFDLLKTLIGPESLENIGHSDEEFSETVLGYVNGGSFDHHAYIINEENKIIRTTEDLENAKRLGMVLGVSDEGKLKEEFVFPVSRRPRIGFSTFDMSFYKNDKGEERVRRHMGNKISEITLKSGKKIIEDKI